MCQENLYLQNPKIVFLSYTRGKHLKTTDESFARWPKESSLVPSHQHNELQSQEEAMFA